MIWEPSILTGWMHLLTFRLFYRCFLLFILVCSLWTFLIFSAFRFVFFLLAFLALWLFTRLVHFQVILALLPSFLFKGCEIDFVLLSQQCLVLGPAL